MSPTRSQRLGPGPLLASATPPGEMPPQGRDSSASIFLSHCPPNSHPRPTMLLGQRRTRLAGCDQTCMPPSRPFIVEVEMRFRFLAVLATQFVLVGAPAGAAETGAPAPLMRIGSSEKVCQLTGDTDWQTGQPTAARTFRNFGLDAVD